MNWNWLGRKQCMTIATAMVLLGCGQIPSVPGTVEPKWSSLYSNYFTNCQSCHAPDAAGRTSDTETSLDFSTAAKGYASVVSGNAAGLTGNFADCNGAKFVVSGQPASSLLVAVIDQPTRTAFQAPGNAACNADAVADMTVKVGSAPPDGFVDALKTWITNGAQND